MHAVVQFYAWLLFFLSFKLSHDIDAEVAEEQFFQIILPLPQQPSPLSPPRNFQVPWLKDYIGNQIEPTSSGKLRIITDKNNQ